MRTKTKAGPKQRPLAERLIGKYVEVDGHWIWTAATTASGYGKVLAQRVGDAPHRYIGAHVASFTVHKGPVPDGHEVDHTCMIKLCINPLHLEAVKHAENMRRSQAPGGAHWLRLRLKEVEARLAAVEARLVVVEAERDELRGRHLRIVS